MVVTKDGLVEEMNAISQFVYGPVRDQWLKYCNERRGGTQSLENLAMLVKSLTGQDGPGQTPNPAWRFLVAENQLVDMIAAADRLGSMSKALEDYVRTLRTWKVHKA